MFSFFRIMCNAGAKNRAVPGAGEGCSDQVGWLGSPCTAGLGCLGTWLQPVLGGGRDQRGTRLVLPSLQAQSFQIRSPAPSRVLWAEPWILGHMALDGSSELDRPGNRSCWGGRSPSRAPGRSARWVCTARPGPQPLTRALQSVLLPCVSSPHTGLRFSTNSI